MKATFQEGNFLRYKQSICILLILNVTLWLIKQGEQTMHKMWSTVNIHKAIKNEHIR